MELATQFIEGLDGPASMTFLGLLLAAFLIGLLPAGLTYAFRIRDLKRRTNKHIDAHKHVTQERNVLENQVKREQEQVATFRQRLQQLNSDRARQEAELTQLRAELGASQAEALTNKVEAVKNEEYLQSLRGKVAAMSSQIQSYKQMARPKPAPNAFDVDTLSSLQTARNKVASLEKRVAKLTADNEMLRKERAKMS
jgi:regulator of replication initiation timing